MAVRILKGHGPRCDLTNSDLVNDNNAFIKNDGAGFTNPHADKFAPDVIVGAINPLLNLSIARRLLRRRIEIFYVH